MKRNPAEELTSFVIHERGTKPIIPNRGNRKQPYSFSKRLYKLRWRIEGAFNRLKDVRRWPENTSLLSAWPELCYGGFSEP